MEPKRNKKIILITILITAVITGSIILAAMQFMNYNADNSNQMKVAIQRAKKNMEDVPKKEGSGWLHAIFG